MFTEVSQLGHSGPSPKNTKVKDFLQFLFILTRSHHRGWWDLTAPHPPVPMSPPGWASPTGGTSEGHRSHVPAGINGNGG